MNLPSAVAGAGALVKSGSLSCTATLPINRVNASFFTQLASAAVASGSQQLAAGAPAQQQQQQALPACRISSSSRSGS
jgi:hypothetical protein